MPPWPSSRSMRYRSARATDNRSRAFIVSAAMHSARCRPSALDGAGEDRHAAGGEIGQVGDGNLALGRRERRLHLRGVGEVQFGHPVERWRAAIRPWEESRELKPGDSGHGFRQREVRSGIVAFERARVCWMSVEYGGLDHWPIVMGWVLPVAHPSRIRSVWPANAQASWYEAAGPPRHRGGKVRPTGMDVLIVLRRGTHREASHGHDRD